jgi:Recombination directionality factor-like
VDQTLRKAPDAKLRSIPVRLLFDDPDLNLRANYTLFDRKTGRPLCVGNGETCRRSTLAGVETLPCPSPQGCELAVGGNCKPCGRFNVRIGDEDELGSFMFRTTGYNSIRTLSTRLKYFHAVSGGLLSTLPLELRLRGKSTTQSHRAPIYYVDLTVRTGMTMAEAIASARAESDGRKASGFDQECLDKAAKQGFAEGARSLRRRALRWWKSSFLKIPTMA